MLDFCASWLSVQTANSGTGGVSGVLIISTGVAAAGVSGAINLGSGVSSNGNSGGLYLGSGTATLGTAGNIYVSVGHGDTGNGGTLVLSAGTTSSSGYTGGEVVVTTGYGSTAGSGNLVLQTVRELHGLYPLYLDHCLNCLLSTGQFRHSSDGLKCCIWLHCYVYRDCGIRK